jgi:hypothetical protein
MTVRTVLTVLTFAALALRAQDREFRVLWVPPPSVPRPLPDIAPASVKATIGGKLYQAVSILPIDAAKPTPLVIVLDFANTNRASHACLVQAVLPFLTRKKEPPAALLAVGASDRLVEARSPQGFLFTLAKPATPQSLDADCRNAPDIPLAQHDRDTLPLDALSSIAGYYAARGGPVRVIWIADRFKWAVKPKSEPCTTSDCIEYDRATRYPHALDLFAEEISESGVTIFALALRERTCDGRARLHYGDFVPPLEDAHTLAEFTGGFATRVTGDPSAALQLAIQLTQSGYRLLMKGPILPRSKYLKEPRALRFSLETGRRGLRLERRFLVSPENSFGPAQPYFTAGSLVGFAQTAAVN